MLRQQIRDRASRDRGGATVFVALIFIVIIFMVALITDGAALRGQRRDAGDLAQRAGRVAIQEVDIQATLNNPGGNIVLDVGAAQVALDYITANDGQGTVVRQGDDALVVTVTMDVPMRFFGDRKVTATRLVGAVDEPAVP